MSHFRRTVATLSLIVFFCAPLTHAGTYFEYAPDAWRSSRLTVSTGETPYQYFQSASDFTLTGFSFWVDNTGSSGNVTFTLLDDQNTTLAEKSITLPQTPAVPGGVRLNVELSTPVEISHYQTYSIQISSTLIGFGLYYSNRINLLEHNLNYTTEYALGVAQLGDEKQDYTFKFALKDPTETGAGSETPNETIITEEEGVVPSSTAPTATLITNARITSITATGATAVWTTNVAANSGVTLRTQINPLYVYNSFSDSTLELEHALTITGLTPKTGYFVDFFSQQSASDEVLTTYTVAFVTAEGEAIAASPVVATEETEEEASSSTTSDVISPATSTSETVHLPQATLGAGSGADSFSINWQTPSGGSPNGGYRIDIFDENNQLVRQLRAPADATSRTVAILPAGEHTAIVYADNNGVYEKVAAPTAFEAKKARSPLFWFWYLIGVILALVLAFAFLFSRREKTELPKLD